ncbi:hypothetical protein [Klebsiella aerogenes]|uniref:hypothetical protein n=1 Tax=Klebsiella aerogenes TaxID=548 RepID=UPI001F2077DC|nr:hypothetical protein [Klebsiella aerogenes]
MIWVHKDLQENPVLTGQSAYQIWLDAGNTDTEDDFLASLQGPAGETPEVTIAQKGT